jgi:sialic acid synthase SpsE
MAFNGDGFINDCIRATELGAVWVEVHFTLDQTLPGADHWWSLDPKELKQLVGAIK